MADVVMLAQLAQALVAQRCWSLADVQRFQSRAERMGRPLADLLVGEGVIGALELARFTAEYFGLTWCDLDQLDCDDLPKLTLEASAVWYEQRLLPLALEGHCLTVATADPSRHEEWQALAGQQGLTLQLVVAEADKLARLLEHWQRTWSMSAVVPSSGLSLGQTRADVGLADDSSVVKLVERLLGEGIAHGASDIHFEPYEKTFRVRYRIDGHLQEAAQLPLALRERIASRLKVVARLDIAEKRLPQDGRFKLALPEVPAVDCRVSTLPTLFGEKIVLRLLDSAAAALSVGRLGLEPAQLAAVDRALARPHGMVLVTGPTGSGKTMSLYAFLQALNQSNVNIATVEDPVEIYLPGVNQVGVNEKAGLGFATALRAFLRQDPDILMVGEIRDLETADIAIKAAQTGHRVLSTLHTNSAPATVTRLLNMGVAPFNVASAVSLIIAQRLVRRLCVHCRQPDALPHSILREAGFDEVELDGSWQPYRAVGCGLCRGSGFRGRVGLFEVMPVTERIARLIMQQGSELDLLAQGRSDGMVELRRAGLNKVRDGLTSLSEVLAMSAG